MICVTQQCAQLTARTLALDQHQAALRGYQRTAGTMSALGGLYIQHGMRHCAVSTSNRLQGRLAAPLASMRLPRPGALPGWQSVCGYALRGGVLQATKGGQGPSDGSPLKGRDPQDILNQLEARLAQQDNPMAPALIRTAFSRLADKYPRCSKSKAVDGQLQRIFETLTERLVAALPLLSAREAVSILQACGRLQYATTPILIACLGWFGARISETMPQQAATVLWALGRLSSSAQPAAAEAARAALQDAPCALSVCISRVYKGLPMAEPHSIASALSGLGMLAGSKERLVATAVQAALQLDPGALPAFFHAFSYRLSSADPRDTANVVWAAAKLRYVPDGQELRRMLATMASPVAEPATPQALSKVLWALSELQQLPSWRPGVLDQHTVQQLVQRFSEVVCTGDSRVISAMQQALSRLVTQPSSAAAALLQLIEPEQMVEESALGGSDEAICCSMALAAAKLGHAHAPQLITSLMSQAVMKLGSATPAGSAAGFSHQDLANLCLAVAVADLPLASTPRYVQQLRVLCSALSEHWDVELQGQQLQSEAKRQLGQLHSWLRKQGLPDVLPQEQLQQCE